MCDTELLFRSVALKSEEMGYNSEEPYVKLERTLLATDEYVGGWWVQRVCQHACGCVLMAGLTVFTTSFPSFSPETTPVSCAWGNFFFLHLSLSVVTNAGVGSVEVGMVHAPVGLCFANLIDFRISFCV